MLNLTPHAIGVVDGVDGLTVHTIPASGQVARVVTALRTLGTLGLPGGVVVPVTSTINVVTGIPAPGGEKFIVSSLVLDRLGQEYRGQAFAPDTGPTAVRKDDGQVIAVRQFRTV